MENITTKQMKDPRQQKRIIVGVSFTIILIFSLLLSLSLGAVQVPIQETLKVLFHIDFSSYQTIVYDLRLPRTLLAMIIGMCLAVSGALLQGVMRNPLADPGIIGVSSGAGLSAVILMIVFPHLLTFLPIAAFLGGMIATLLIFLLAFDKKFSPVKIILSGVALNAMLGAMTSFIMILYSDRVQSVLAWLSGSLSGKSWAQVEMVAPYAIIGFIFSFLCIRSANTLILGDEKAQLLGINVSKHRFLILVVSAFLAGIAVSVSGLIGFVGLVVPHMVRILVGNDYRYLIPFSAIGGGALVVLCDFIARTVFDPIEVPVGLLLAMVGGPFFLYLLYKGGTSYGESR